MPCLGNGKSMCCFIKGEPCPYVIYDYTDENGHFRKWACFLRAELGDWDKVLEDQRYKDLKASGAWHRDTNCRDWPDAKEGPNKGICHECGVNV
jgi:hypothetical protein